MEETYSNIKRKFRKAQKRKTFKDYGHSPSNGCEWTLVTTHRLDFSSYIRVLGTEGSFSPLVDQYEEALIENLSLGSSVLTMLSSRQLS